MLQGVALSKTYGGQTVVNDVTVSLSPGQGLAVLGENGSGKSTLLAMLALALKPDSGSVQLDGLPLVQVRNAIGYMPQDIALFDDLTVSENLRCFCRVSGQEAMRREKRLLSALCMEPLRKKRLDKLSGGQRRRVSLAVSLMNEPRYLLLDEPFAGIDKAGEACIISLLAQVMAQGCGIAVVAHHMEALAPIIQHVLRLDQGHAVFSGTLCDFLQERS